jgi:CRISPR-associated protein Cmr5
MQTKEQNRSRFALEMINEHFPQGAVDKESANFIVGIPTMILTNGIAQTLAFLLSNKNKEKQYVVFKIVRTWLEQEIAGLHAKTEMGFLQHFTQLQPGDYLKAQREALAMLHWLKRYARAFEV